MDGSRRIYAVGGFSSYNATSVGNFIRLFPNETLDTTFAAGAGITGGITYAAFPIADRTGRLYVFGAFSAYQGISLPSLVRLRGDGSLDSVH